MIDVVNVGAQFLTSTEAAVELGVGVATLYAYVSRGMIRSEPQPGSRRRLYRAEDVRALKGRHGEAGTPAPWAEGSLEFGPPVLESSITLVSGGRLRYRGLDVEDLARGSRLEAVAGLIWGAASDDPFADGLPPVPWPAPDPALPPLVRCIAGLPVLAEGDPRRFDRSPRGVARTGARLLRWTAALLAGTEPSTRPVHEVLAASWGVSEGADLLRAALVVCADHELNASTFAVRVTASTGATPDQALVAGLCCLLGPRHGGMVERVGRLLDEAGGDPRGAVAGRLRRGEDLPGFGHPLYPEGDPRARVLAGMLPEGDPALAAYRRLAGAVEDLAGLKPSMDAALVALVRYLGLPDGAALSLFALGRCVGWIGHAQEQYADGRLIRPRARYVGPMP